MFIGLCCVYIFTVSSHVCVISVIKLLWGEIYGLVFEELTLGWYTETLLIVYLGFFVLHVS